MSKIKILGGQFNNCQLGDRIHATNDDLKTLEWGLDPDTQMPVGSTIVSLRQFIDKLLPTDADLEAFCVDYFPALQRQFARGMERDTRVSILIERAGQAHLHAALAKYSKLRL